MNSNKVRSLSLIGLVTIVLASGGTYFKCSVIGGCTFGKYQGKLIVRNLTEDSPVANANVTAYINNGDFFFVNSGEYYFTTTDATGTAVIEFERAFNSPLTITLSSNNPYKRIGLNIQSKDIKAHTNISRTATEYDSSPGTQNDLIELRIEVGDWSLF
jgi:hypothetical protein